MKKIFTVLALLCVFWLSSSMVPVHALEKGIALSFDDTYIDEWYAQRELFNKYQAKVTFYVTHPSTLTTQQWIKLKALQTDGHEIGCHALNHTVVPTYLQTHTMDEYIQTEIIPSIELFKSHGIQLTSFSYPTGASTPESHVALLNIFKNVRTTTTTDKGTIPIETLEAIYYKFDSRRILTSTGIDNTHQLPEGYVENGFLRAKETNQVIMLHGHKITESNELAYFTTPHTLEAVLSNATNNGLRFYRMSELTKSGDTDGNGRINGLDYVVWLNHYGQLIYGISKGDFNIDGEVNGVDYVTWLNNYES